MKTPSHRLRDLLLGFTLLTVALPTVLTYRGLLQPNYQWGLFGLHGMGTSGPWWQIFLIAALGWITLALNHRNPGRGSTTLLAFWHGGLFLNVLFYALKHGEKMSLRGDAIGVSIHLGWIGPLFTGACLALSLILSWRSWVTPPDPAGPLTRSAKNSLILGMILIVAIAIFFRFGDGVRHTVYDRIAIGLVVFQCLVIASGLREPAKLRLTTGQVLGPHTTRNPMV